MQFIQTHKVFYIVLLFVVALFIFVLVQFLYIKYNGQVVPAPKIPRETQTFGEGKPLEFVVLGDSTSIGQGAEYSQSIATKSAEYLARNYKVNLTNFGVSGAITSEVLTQQVDKAVALTPDVVLIATGANDVTKFTPYHTVDESMRAIIQKLKRANPEVEIILTGSPQVGSVTRFPWPTNELARHRVGKINETFDRIAQQENVVRIPLAEETGPLFQNNPSLFAKDNFHPNAAGYATWQPIINRALDTIK
ncbi:MAG TPA: SGNH/GDSL hydrolase family protein [Candidatus Nitrosotenuis sp.]|nr:SGNH/GDSL hydrolase family protein [Candidatus Nitrosotenuis sp.]